MYTTTKSLTVDRWIARFHWPRRGAVAAIGMILILIPIVLAYLEVRDEIFPFFTNSGGRLLFFSPSMITYLIAVMGPLEKTREYVAQALRPLVQADDDHFASVVNQACHINPAGELIAFAVGVVFAFGIGGPYESHPEYPILSLYLYLASLIMFGTIGWSIYGAITFTRLTNALLRLPVHIDIFDSEALVPIGRQSLYLALTFVGAIILSLFFIVSTYSLGDLLSLQNIIIYSVLILLAIAVFYLNMHRTHSMLAAAKRQQLRLTEQNLARAYYILQDSIAKNQDTYAASTELNALATSKQELKLTRTWPYNTEILRILFVSVLTPLAVGLARGAVLLFLN